MDNQYTVSVFSPTQSSVVEITPPMRRKMRSLTLRQRYMEKCLSHLIRLRAEAWVWWIVDGGRLEGWSLLYHPAGRFDLLDVGVYVRKQSRRKGIGSVLVRAAIGFARSNLQDCNIQVFFSNTGGTHLYASLNDLGVIGDADAWWDRFEAEKDAERVPQQTGNDT